MNFMANANIAKKPTPCNRTFQAEIWSIMRYESTTIEELQHQAIADELRMLEPSSQVLALQS